jgi:anti-sigma-K factor RskA
MPDSLSTADEATLFVLGLLPEEQRRDFELRLANSRELRASVRALEDGVLALTMAMPRRNPPPQAWQNIQTAIKEEKAPRTLSLLFRSPGMRHGLAAAACAILGWCLHLWWTQEGASSSARPEVAVREPSVRQAVSSAPLPAPVTVHVSPRPETFGHTSLTADASSFEERKAAAHTAALQRRIAELETQVSHLTRTATQHQSQGPDLSRLSFFNLSPQAATSGRKSSPSPELQRALLVALARELGWLSPRTQMEGQEQKHDDHAPVTPQSHEAGVDFVDLTPAGSATPRRPEPLASDVPPSTNPAGSDVSTSLIPAFAGASNLTFALDAATAGGDTITVWSAEGSGQPVSLGNVALKAGSTVVTVPFHSSARGTHVTITAGATIIGHFSSAAAVP